MSVCLVFGGDLSSLVGLGFLNFCARLQTPHQI